MPTVLIFGAGPAGLSCALRLASAGIDVEVMDAGRDTPAPPGETLSPAGALLVERLGVHVDQPAGWSTWSIWGSPERRPHDWIQDPRGAARFVDRNGLEAALRARLQEACAIRRGRCSGTPTHDGTAWSVPTADGVAQARVLVDATGRVRALARRVGATVEILDRQIAVAATSPAHAPGTFGLVESEPHGWWYSAPTPNGDLALLAVSSADVARSRRSSEALATALQDAPETRDRVGARPLQDVRLVDAGSSRLTVPVGDAWLAVGDAAMAWDPLSAHGLTVALRSGIDAAAALVATLGGQVSALDDYVETLHSAWAQYVTLRTHIYAAERRWPKESYWATRPG
jgi:flavin-dependent dehydrogenase